jgi:hypothetical protein
MSEPVPVHGFEELRALEQELERAWAHLQEEGQGYAGVRALLADSKLAPEEREARLRAACEVQEGFLAQLDDFQRRTHAHFLEQVVRELERAMETFDAFYGPRQHRRLRRRHRKLVELAERYRELAPLYGTPRDHERIALYQRFYAQVVDFSQRIRALDPTMPRPAPRSWWDDLHALRRGALRWARRSGAALRLVWAALCVVTIAVRKKQPERGTPFTNRVDDFFRALCDLNGWKVRVLGEPPPASADAVTLYTPTHRHGITDNATFCHLRLPDYLVFNAVDQVQLVPKWLKDRAATTNGLVPVGGGRGPSVKRALEMLDAGITRNVLIYPEGTVSEGFRGTRPPRATFGEKLVPAIRAAGHPVRLVPVAYLDNARFLDIPPRARIERELRVVVCPHLDAARVDALLASGGGPFLNGMLRLAWLESLTSDADHFLGHDRVAAIESRLDRELDGIRYWGSLASAPVPDRLRLGTPEPMVVREEPFHGKRVRVLRIPDAAVNGAGRIPLPDLAPSDSHEFLIGIRKPAHIYMNVGRQRFDGDIFRPLRVRERDYVYPGILIRFPRVPVKSLNAIRRGLEELLGRETRTLTCANSACQVMARAANLKIDDSADLRPFLPSHVLPTRTMRKLIERGVSNHMGETVEVQIYKTDDRPLEQILAEARREEIRIAGDHLRGISVDLLRRAGEGLRAGWRATRSGLRGAVRRLVSGPGDGEQG